VGTLDSTALFIYFFYKCAIIYPTHFTHVMTYFTNNHGKKEKKIKQANWYLTRNKNWKKNFIVYVNCHKNQNLILLLTQLRGRHYDFENNQFQFLFWLWIIKVRQYSKQS
jgi:hypothetical protein